MMRRPRRSTLFPSTTLFRSLHQQRGGLLLGEREAVVQLVEPAERDADGQGGHRGARVVDQGGRLVGRRDGVLVDELLALLLVLYLGDQRRRDRRGDVDVALADPVDDGGVDVGQLDEDQVAAGSPAWLLQRPGGGGGHVHDGARFRGQGRREHVHA